MTVDAGPEAPVSVPCRACQSPVFDGERFCEVCGTGVAPDAAGDPPKAKPAVTERVEYDLVSVAAVTDRGRRRHRNEDAVAILAKGGHRAAVVADGVASTANPDRAARAACEAALRVLEPALGSGNRDDADVVEERLVAAFAEAQGAVASVPDHEPDGNDLSPSTTLVAAWVSPDRAIVASVGDSRAYWIAGSGVGSRLLTVDDSWAQERIAEGADPTTAYADPDANTITRWLGADAESTEPKLTTFDVTEPGWLVVCSDGMWNYFDTVEDLFPLVEAASGTNALGVARALTEAALQAGGRDNITVAVVPVPDVNDGTDAEAPSPSKE
jgi:serine/threonine protein phosphatase PrpC